MIGSFFEFINHLAKVHPIIAAIVMILAVVPVAITIINYLAMRELIKMIAQKDTVIREFHAAINANTQVLTQYRHFVETFVNAIKDKE